MSAEKTFTFHVELYTSIEVPAASQEEAQALIEERMQNVDANFGCWPNGDPIVAEVGIPEDGIYAVPNNQD